MRIMPSQIVAGRGLLGWNQATFAKMSGLAVGSIRAVEGDSEKNPSGLTVTIAAATIMAQGVEFFFTKTGAPAVSIRADNRRISMQSSLPKMEAIPQDRVLALLAKGKVDPESMASALIDLKVASITESMAQVISALSVARQVETEAALYGDDDVT